MKSVYKIGGMPKDTLLDAANAGTRSLGQLFMPSGSLKIGVE